MLPAPCLSFYNFIFILVHFNCVLLWTSHLLQLACYLVFSFLFLRIFLKLFVLYLLFLLLVLRHHGISHITIIYGYVNAPTICTGFVFFFFFRVLAFQFVFEVSFPFIICYYFMCVGVFLLFFFCKFFYANSFTCDS